MGQFSRRCLACSILAAGGQIACTACGSALGFEYATGDLVPDPAWSGMWRWRRWLPVPENVEPVTLGEGSTPLLRARLDLPLELWIKDESRNPTGSHKDRALAVAITDARARGVRRSAVVSAGSTGLAHAAYCARAGIESVVIMGSDTAPERAALVAALGARPIRVRAPIDDAIGRLQELGDQGRIHVASTTRRSNPEQAEGCKTIAYEIVEALGRAPDLVVVPTGGGGTIGAVHRGFRDALVAGVIDRVPRLVAVVPERWNGLQRALAAGSPRAASVAAEHPPATILGKLCHACPPDGADALSALRESNGTVIGVSDMDAMAAQGEFAALEGLYLEVSSAVILPALRQLLATGFIKKGASVVALACGSGFRELPFNPPPLPTAELVDLADLEHAVGAVSC